MILTFTPSPSLDRAYDVAELAVGEVNRASGTHVHAGGKGINVSRALARNGVATVAVLPTGGPDGEQLLVALERQGVSSRPVPVAGDTRSNVTLVDQDGVTTKINAPSPELSTDEIRALVEAVDAEAARGARWIVAAGSLPDGSGDLFSRLVEVSRRRGVPLALDTSGAPLRDTLATGGIALVKPNDDELAELVGADLHTVGDVRDAARELIAAGTGAVLVSLGAHGAMLVTPDGSWWAGGTALVPLSTVGAGDTTLAGYLSTDGSPSDRLRRAVAWGRAAVLLPGSDVPDPTRIDIADVRVVDDPDPRLTLKEL
ncbi:1-phosphofructokinase family hexose kinase [Cellulomonas sp. P24]|uniref:1-phosphofructokinase family hexose kinase n=1 Tax=Cellulomonas sp. P24 TaxID=2885206 RepID=UPI00216B26CF|nr:1-phosphofructokinase family hexose kinase [Cellulomonas sp. P24]MCR6492223.1 1-phosphofructokinase family hexose kinase [Cellulomonas sp. P24]